MFSNYKWNRLFWVLALSAVFSTAGAAGATPPVRYQVKIFGMPVDDDVTKSAFVYQMTSPTSSYSASTAIRSRRPIWPPGTRTWSPTCSPGGRPSAG